MASTYQPDTIKALRAIRRYLKTNAEETSAAIDKTRSDLQQYEAVGEDFEAVVAEYAKVRADIEGKLWALQELKEKTDKN